MRNLIILFLLVTSSQLFAQQSGFETNLFLAGSIQNNQTKPRVNKGFSILPDITYRFSNKFAIGVGFEYAQLNKKYLEPVFINVDSSSSHDDYSLQRRHLTSEYFGTRIINRINKQFNDKLSMVIGFDFGVYRSLENRVEFKEPQINSYDVKISGIKFQHYVGLKYQVNKRFSLTAYVDLFSLSYSKEKFSSGEFSTGITNGAIFSNGGTGFIKIGASWRF